MKDYAYIVSKDENMIKEVKDILNKKEKLKEIDFENIQKQRKKKFEKLFNS